MLQNWILSASKMLLIQLAAHHFVREKFMLFCSNIAYFSSLQKQDLQKFSRNTFTIIAENNYNFLKYNFCCKNDSSDCFTLYSIYTEPTCCLKLRMQGSKTCPLRKQVRDWIPPTGRNNGPGINSHLSTNQIMCTVT